MLNEKQNNFPGWKSKLEEADFLPGDENGDKDELWDKLHARLETKPARVKAIWYWAAAAILLAILIPLLNKSTKETSTFVKTPAQDKTNPVIIPVLPDKVKESVDVFTAINVEKKPAFKTKATLQNEIRLKVTPKNAIPDEIVVETGIEKIEAKSTIMQPLTGTKTITETVIAAAVPVNKKMKIVHINEMETFPEPLYSSGKQVQKAFRIELGNTRHNQSTSARKEYTSALQLKIPL